MYRKRYAHVTNAMKAASAARVRIVLAGHVQCPKCHQLIAGVKDGIFPEHYVIGKIPCGWREQRPTTLAVDAAPISAADDVMALGLRH